MAACGSLRSLFENPLPENPTLIESFSTWNQIKSMKPIEAASYAEIFGELYFQEKPHVDLPVERSSAPPALCKEKPRVDLLVERSSALDQIPQSNISECDAKRESMTLDSLLGMSKDRAKNNGGFSVKSTGSLQLCTEGLGSESSDDVDDLMENGDDWRSGGKGKVNMGRRRTIMANGVHDYTRSCWETRREASAKVFPPPISSIGKSGKPRVCLRSYREDGRFVLREMRIPCQEYLRASREDGRLKLRFVRPDESIEEGDEEQEEDGRTEENKENVCES